MPGTVFFVSEIRPPADPRATSTHIMTYSLLRGLAENGCRVVFFAVCEDEKTYGDAGRAFDGKVSSTVPLRSRFGGIRKGDALTRLIRMLSTGLRAGFYKKIDVPRLEKPSLILTHCPSVEAAYYGDELHMLFPGVPYYQFWSDPLAMSGTVPGKLGVKRVPFRIAEARAIKRADRIIYGTEPLCSAEKKVFPKHARKMFYCDVPCVETQDTDAVPDRRRAVYAGNYYLAFRDIGPLCRAAASLPELTLDVYGDGDPVDISADNVRFHGRIPPEELSIETAGAGVSVCVLNSKSVQIPGKLFYEAGSRRGVLVITEPDNPYSTEISEYLKKYRRFVFCENRETEISAALNALCAEEPAAWEAAGEFTPRAVAGTVMRGGLSDE